MSKRLVLWFGNLLLLIAIVLVAFGSVFYRQEAVDWWRLRQYQPPAEILQLADATTMEGEGRDLFYVSEPDVQDKDQFNATCQSGHAEQSLVLGCYKAQHIYIYNVSDARLNGVKEVTAAHEMLHAAYERFDASEQARIDALLQAQMDANTDQRIAGLIALYNTQEPGHIHNEMHSIFGTEVANVSPELEEHYSQYFTDRQKVVTFSQGYEAVFNTSRQRISELKIQLADLKAAIDSQNQGLAQQETELQQMAASMSRLRGSDVQAYNAQVPEYNQRVRTFNDLVVSTRTAIENYNRLVEEHNTEIAAQSSLYQGLNSNYQPAAQTN